MTREEHNTEMNQQAERYLEKISKLEETIQDLKYKLRQYETAAPNLQNGYGVSPLPLTVSAVGWLFKQASIRPEVEP